MDPTRTLLSGLSRPDPGLASRDRIDLLSNELAEGRVSDPGHALRSDFSRIARHEHGLGTLAARTQALATAETWTARMAMAVDRVAADHEGLMTRAVAAFDGANPVAQATVAADAEGLFADMVMSLGVAMNGRALFANGASGAPLPEARTLTDILRPIADAAPDLDGLFQAFDDFFAPGGTFETDHLSDFDATPVRFGFGESGHVAIRADLDDPGLRGALRDAALVAMSGEGPLADPAARPAIQAALLERMSETGSDLIALQATLGSANSRLSGIGADLSAQASQMERAMNDALGVDPFETATRLQAEMGRLESIYAITARRARLSLTGYLR